VGLYKFAEKSKVVLWSYIELLERSRKMDNRIALRIELEKAIAETGCTLSSIAEVGGLSIGNSRGPIKVSAR